MTQHQNSRKNQRSSEQPHSSDTEDLRERQQSAHFQSGQQQAEHRSQSRGQQGAYPDNRGQQGQYGIAPGNEYGNSPTNPYAKNPGGSPGSGEPWRDEPYGLEPQYGPDYQHAAYGNSEIGRRNQERGSYPGGQSQYAEGRYQGYREQGGYPVGNYERGSENYRGPGYQGGGDIHQPPYESARGYGHERGEHWDSSNQIGQRSRGYGGDRDEAYSDEFDPHYRQWRSEQIRQLDDDYRKWRAEYYERFSAEFNEWRRSRLEQGKPIEGKESPAEVKRGEEAAGGSQNKGK